MENVKNMQIFEPSYHYIDDGKEHGVLSKFNPGIQTLPKGYQVAPIFRPLPVARPVIYETLASEPCQRE